MPWPPSRSRGPMTAHRLILDMDMGVDDAMALMYLGHHPEADVVAIGAVHGNVSAALSAENVLRILDHLGLSHVPVAVGAERGLTRPAHPAPEVHGDDGLGNVGLAKSSREPVTEDAALQLIRLARSAPGTFDVVATGPLTNLAMALILDPGLPSLVRHVTVMGGTATVIGQMTPVAEANIWHDPAAAELVFNAGWPITMVGLDVTNSTLLTPLAQRRLAASETPTGRLTWAMLQHYLDFSERIFGRRVCPIHDPLAAAVAIDPSYVTQSIQADVHVEDWERTRGLTIVDRRGGRRPEEPIDHARVEVVLGVDSDRFVTDLVSALDLAG